MVEVSTKKCVNVKVLYMYTSVYVCVRVCVCVCVKSTLIYNTDRIKGNAKSSKKKFGLN